jgi:hypothetical protein
LPYGDSFFGVDELTCRPNGQQTGRRDDRDVGGGKRDGWKIGAGAQLMLAPQWSAKAQYTFLDIGSDHLASSLERTFRSTRSSRRERKFAPATRSVIGELGAHAEGKGPAIQPALSVLISATEPECRVCGQIGKSGQRRSRHDLSTSPAHSGHPPRPALAKPACSH